MYVCDEQRFPKLTANHGGDSTGIPIRHITVKACVGTEHPICTFFSKNIIQISHLPHVPIPNVAVFDEYFALTNAPGSIVIHHGTQTRSRGVHEVALIAVWQWPHGLHHHHQHWQGARVEEYVTERTVNSGQLHVVGSGVGYVVPSGGPTTAVRTDSGAKGSF